MHHPSGGYIQLLGSSLNPVLLGFMEASSRRHGQLSAPFPASLPGVEDEVWG